MTKPIIFLLRMGLFLLAVLALGASMLPTLTKAFSANPKLDAIILAVLLLGIVWNFRIVQRLMPEVNWVESLRHARTSLTAPRPPRLLAPMASMLASRNQSGRLSLSPQTTQAMLDSLSSRLDESREISRYMTQLLIFLGLLGTFYGLLLTVSSIAAVIAGMSPGTGDLDTMFNQLKTGLAGPLAGMSTAFSGSMFGLAGALVLGFLDLNAGQAQSRFFNELEEWLVGLTRVSHGTALETDGAPIPAYVQALLEQTAENLETLQNAVSRSEEGRVREVQILDGIQERLRGMTELLRANQHVMTRTTETQTELLTYLRALQGDHQAEAANSALVRIDMRLARLGEELQQGRTQTTGEIRNDLRLLARTIAASSSTSAKQD